MGIANPASAAFNGYDGPELWVHPNNQHPNEKAHAIVADAIFRFLREQGLVERRLRSAGP